MKINQFKWRFCYPAPPPIVRIWLTPASVPVKSNRRTGRRLHRRTRSELRQHPLQSVKRLLTLMIVADQTRLPRLESIVQRNRNLHIQLESIRHLAGVSQLHLDPLDIHFTRWLKSDRHESPYHLGEQLIIYFNIDVRVSPVRTWLQWSSKMTDNIPLCARAYSFQPVGTTETDDCRDWNYYVR